MRIFTSRWKRPFNIVAVGPGWVAASTTIPRRRDGLEIWSLHSGESLCSDKPGDPAYGIAIDPAGTLFVSDAEGFRVLDLASGSEFPGPKLYHSAFALALDGSRLLASYSINENGALGAWERQPDGTFRALWQEGFHAFLWYGPPSLSPNGQLAVSNERSLGGASVFGQLVARKAATGTPLCRIELERPNDWFALGMSNGGKLLGLTKRSVTIWNGLSGEPLAIVRNPVRKMLTAVAVHPGGRWFATADSNGTVRIWDMENFQERTALNWQVGCLQSLSFSPDGTVAAAGTADGRVVVWDVDL